jgi:uncharacterized membrane protein (Fun14 family)
MNIPVSEGIQMESMGTLTSLIPQGLPLVGGGLIGFTLGYICKKLVILAVIGLGLVFALIAFLAYQKWVTVDWAIVQSQTSTFIQTSTRKMLDVVNNTAQVLGHHSLNHIDITYPLLGVTGFVPGFIFGLAKG